MGDLPQRRHVFASACRSGGGGSGSVGGERSFGVRPATQTRLEETGGKSISCPGSVNRAHSKCGDVA
jgi:hypothetical protein